MTAAAIAMAAALTAWGPIAPVGDSGVSVPGPTAPDAPAATVQPLAPPAPPAAAPAPAPFRPTPFRPMPYQPALIAKAPVDAHAAPAFFAAQRRPTEKPLYKSWGFWLVSGGIFTATVILTIIVTRPGPQPYSGNAPPFQITLP